MAGTARGALPGPMTRTIGTIGAVLLLVAASLTACGGSSPEVQTAPDGTLDPQLVEGRDVYGSNCASCHGNSGGGGRGPALDDGRMVEEYPDVADQIDVVTNGKGGMPAFGEKLTPAEIEAVVAYTREVL